MQLARLITIAHAGSSQKPLYYYNLQYSCSRLQLALLNLGVTGTHLISSAGRRCCKPTNNAGRHAAMLYAVVSASAQRCGTRCSAAHWLLLIVLLALCGGARAFGSTTLPKPAQPLPQGYPRGAREGHTQTKPPVPDRNGKSPPDIDPEGVDPRAAFHPTGHGSLQHQSWVGRTENHDAVQHIVGALSGWWCLVVSVCRAHLQRLQMQVVKVAARAQSTGARAGAMLKTATGRTQTRYPTGSRGARRQQARELLAQLSPEERREFRFEVSCFQSKQ